MIAEGSSHEYSTAACLARNSQIIPAKCHSRFPAASDRQTTFLSFFFNEPRNTASRRRSSGRLNRGRAEHARKARRFCRSRKPPPTRAVNPLSPSLSSGERPASLAGSRLVRTHAKETRASAIDERTDGRMDGWIAGLLDFGDISQPWKRRTRAAACDSARAYFLSCLPSRPRACVQPRHGSFVIRDVLLPP